MLNTECPLQDRPLDWQLATDEELLECLKAGPLDPRCFNYIKNHRPRVLRRSLLEHVEQGGRLMRTAIRFLRGA